MRRSSRCRPIRPSASARARRSTSSIAGGPRSRSAAIARRATSRSQAIDALAEARGTRGPRRRARARRCGRQRGSARRPTRTRKLASGARRRRRTRTPGARARRLGAHAAHRAVRRRSGARDRVGAVRARRRARAPTARAPSSTASSPRPSATPASSRPRRQLLDHALASTDPLRPDQRAVLELNLGSDRARARRFDRGATTLTKARDRVIGAFGDRHPELALYDDKLAAARRARGKLRDALALHDRSLALRTAAFGADDRAVATSLYHRAADRARGRRAREGRALAARRDRDPRRTSTATPARASASSTPRSATATSRATTTPTRAITSRKRSASIRASHPRCSVRAPTPAPSRRPRRLAPDELLSIDRAAALVAEQRHAPGELAAIAASLHDRYRPELDPALTVLVARALFAAGDHARGSQSCSPPRSIAVEQRAQSHRARRRDRPRAMRRPARRPSRAHRDLALSSDAASSAARTCR